MAEDQIAGKTAADKRKAMLALAADRAGEAGACPSPSEMADFVSGTCSEEEKQQVLRHVSLCRRCYGEWLILADMQMGLKRGQRKAERIPFYRKPANLAALVSAMAAVICVGLFLDINPFGYRIEPSEKSIAPTQLDSGLPAERQQLPAVRESVPADTGRKQEQPQPPPPAATPETMNRQDQSGPAEEAKGLAPDTTMMPAAPSAQAMRQNAAPASAAADRAGSPASGEADAGREMAGPASDTATWSSWEEQMLSTCRQEQETGSTSVSRQALFQAGKRSQRLWLRERQATADPSPSPSPLLSILRQAETKEQLFARCREILATAGEDRR
ncbi:MAG: hypothetical protein F9K32_13420 [Desulfobulbaceae bacterium]|nr:MAG: hypothetical protein F9K32_13420 [Desulfobulbaceae bacterium]